MASDTVDGLFTRLRSPQKRLTTDAEKDKKWSKSELDFLPDGFHISPQKLIPTNKIDGNAVSGCDGTEEISDAVRQANVSCTFPNRLDVFGFIRIDEVVGIYIHCLFVCLFILQYFNRTKCNVYNINI